MKQLDLPLIAREENNVVIAQRAYDGYINATAMCKAAGKNFADYSRSKNTSDFISELSVDMGNPITE
ncbi:KilA-N domain-containing protein [Xenorhabdus griffiniae]|uniref:KilA-N domain-containing protein n=1 Tax=Xenorhabdus griffiniae TaxID=351672 RepID=A0ABY9XDR4_9GAMM|nr:KilA-N domain-containing protein [Xenorhabdus griffiniae]MBD1228978.1 KilA-N domain-containing protein [Xenorhabdus griffiniae]MBE8588913.1 KilA-N domain-containing protein [Xenorhabdus griffiniae]WMV70978.1 KilA-N domain-containing protein [Xenorhabdus griffiniae]WNH00654.1 KilA-N domain-containing protein [Xenorhabdus griffiniae]